MLPVDGGAASSPARRATPRLRLLQILRLYDLDPAAGAPERALGRRFPDGLLSDGKGEGCRRGAAPPTRAAPRRGGRGGPARHGRERGLAGRRPAARRPAAAATSWSWSRAQSPTGIRWSKRSSGAAVLEAGRSRLGEGSGAYRGPRRRSPTSSSARPGSRLRTDAASRARAAHAAAARIGIGRGRGSVDADSTARFSAEYRKLASLVRRREASTSLDRARQRRGSRRGGGLADPRRARRRARRDEALAKIRRRVAGAEDPLAERLYVLRPPLRIRAAGRWPWRERSRQRALGAARASFETFKNRVAPALQKALTEAGLGALAKLHPFRLHKAYLAAARFPAERLSHASRRGRSRPSAA